MEIQIRNKILVTGGCGFIGKNYIRMLLRKNEETHNNIISIKDVVVNLDSLTYAAEKDFSIPQNLASLYYFIKGDINNYKLVKKIIEKFDINVIVNFAAETHVDNSIENSKNFIHSNINGVHNLLELVRENPHIHFHQVSTDEVFGSLEDGDYYWTEDRKYDPHSPYSASKAAADHLVRSYHDTYGINYTISHCVNNYGAGQHKEKLIPKVLDCLKNKKEIPIYGQGLQKRCWIHVSDHCEAIDHIILLKDKPNIQNHTFNITNNDMKLDGRAISNIDFVEHICEMYDNIYKAYYGIETEDYTFDSKKLIKFVDDRAGHDFKYGLNDDKIRKIGFTPKISLNIGLTNLILETIKKGD